MFFQVFHSFKRDMSYKIRIISVTERAHYPLKPLRFRLKLRKTSFSI